MEEDRSKKVGIAILPIQGRKTITLLNVAYTPKHDSNLISLGQFRKFGILYHNHPNSMILQKENSIFRVVNRHKNLFIFDTSLRMVLVKGKGRPTYLLSSNPQICFWHCYLGHASNVGVIQASKLVNKIDLGRVINSEDKLHSSDSEPEKENNKKLNANAKNKLVFIKKLSKNCNDIEQLYK